MSLVIENDDTGRSRPVDVLHMEWGRIGLCQRCHSHYCKACGDCPCSGHAQGAEE